jgi:hypothetical protein
MFAKSDGPTALRSELVRALAFSEGKAAQAGDDELVESVAALAAVWNGRKGYVALLVRAVMPPTLERYVTENAITSPEALAVMTEEAIAFAESLGFSMDASVFVELSEMERDVRMQRWNKLRKLRKPSGSRVTGAPNPGDTGEFAVPDPPSPPMPSGLDIRPDELDELSVPAPPPIPEIEIEMSAADIVDGPADPDADTSLMAQPQGSAVLGKISLVRRGGADARRLEQIARLLAFF